MYNIMLRKEIITRAAATLFLAAGMAIALYLGTFL